MAKKALPRKNRDMAATIGVVHEVRDELKADLRGLEARIEARFSGVSAQFSSQDGRFAQIDRRFAQIDERFAQIDERFARVDARMDTMDEKLEKILASVHRTQALVEEQRSENRIMLEALLGFNQRMDRMERRQDDFDLTLRSLIKSRP